MLKHVTHVKNHRQTVNRNKISREFAQGASLQMMSETSEFFAMIIVMTP